MINMRREELGMKRTVIYHSKHFDVVSYGNGLSYALHDNERHKSIFFQYSAAAQFRQDIEFWEQIDPEKSYDEIYSEIMSEYEWIAERNRQ